MSDDYIRVLFFRDYYEEAKDFGGRVEEEIPAKDELIEASGQMKSEDFAENKTAYDKFLKMAKYANEIASKLGWFVSVEIHNERIGVIWVKTDAICFLGFEAERIKFEGLLGMADEYKIVNNRFDSDLLEIEMQVEIYCAVVKDNKKETE